MQRDRAVGHGDTVRHADEPAEGLLEGMDLRSLAGDPAGQESVEQPPELVAGDVRPRHLDRTCRAVDLHAGQPSLGIRHDPQPGFARPVVAQGQEGIAAAVPG